MYVFRLQIYFGIDLTHACVRGLQRHAHGGGNSRELSSGLAAMSGGVNGTSYRLMPPKTSRHELSGYGFG